ncbi:extracellular solute-binding protein [Catellatospora tritici]|uniref:extracellular solute-binding protein n=1 Tax=Catellatospora tritici TaxID=2851566 RepID=UPI001C2D3B6E|nr:extracellular solute-binding protein [Catellatospora tritici]MBV1848987.1 extracellular solute-binding protein [Catellatospora tritici]
MDHPLPGTANRRSFLTLVGLGAVAAASGGALAGCTEKAADTGSAAEVDKLSAVLPKFKPLDLVQPDIKGVSPVANGFTKYPANLVDAITEKPGRGSTITTMTPYWGTVPAGPGQNAYVDAINAELGAIVTPGIQDGNTYADKLNTIMGARDVPEVVCIPSWEIPKIPNFSDAVKALFEDLTDHLAGDKALPYAMLANLPTVAWSNAVWNQRLMAVPWPTDGPYPWALFYRKDLTDALGATVPKTADELYAFGKAVTNADKGVWAFNDIQAMVEMIFRVPGAKEGWRSKGGKVEFKYETEEFKAALEFLVKVFKDGLVHPEVIASKGADAKLLFNGGKIVMVQDGVGAWLGVQAEQQKVTPAFNMQPVPFFAADGGTPLVHGSGDPIFFTFVKKGLGKEKTEEILRVLNFIAAPLGTKEFELIEYGVDGKHFTKGADGWPAGNDLLGKEKADQFRFLAGTAPTIKFDARVPSYVTDLINWENASVQHIEVDPWRGIKLEMPASYVKVKQPTEDKIKDIVRGRRPVSDLEVVLKEWRDGGGEDGRAFMAKALSDAGR